MKPTPLVSVICLCYNHSPFLRTSILSVLNQTYSAIQIIVVDDASTDSSAQEIRKLKEEYPALECLFLQTNVGNCKAFNRGFAQAKGTFIVDLATDDIMDRQRIEKQVEFFDKLPNNYGVVFTDADYVDVKDKFMYQHFAHLFRHKLLSVVPEGDVYKDVLATYFIAPPTMMFKREVVEYLGGYDEALAYEDFDFWVRSARKYRYGFLNERLTKIRKTKHSHSTRFYQKGDRQLHSTYLVCVKARELNRTPDEDKALVKRLQFEIRQSSTTGNRIEAELFYNLLKEMKENTLLDSLWMAIRNLPISLAGLRRKYHDWRYNPLKN